MSRFILILVMLAFSRTPACAAAIVWVGGQGGDWGQSTNWSGAAVPSAVDDVSIGAELVVAYSTGPLVSIRSLSLGGSGAILRVATGVVVSGDIVLQTASAIQVSTPTLLSAGSLTLHAGSSVSYVGPEAGLSISAGLFDLRAGATVTLKGRGYAGAAVGMPGGGPGGGGAGSGAGGAGGGGHGGAGGLGGGAANGGTSNGSLFPEGAGSGGGGGNAAAGGAGGGFLRVNASSAILDGYIEADGETGDSSGVAGGGGGAGGSVVIESAVLTGSGTVRAAGGAGGSGGVFGGGGGGGGRIWLRELSGDQVVHSDLAVRVDGGGAGGGPTAGSAGSAGSSFIDPRHWIGSGADSLASNPANWSGHLIPRGGERVVFGASETAKNCLWDMPAVAVGSAALTNSFSAMVILSSSMNVTGTFDLRGGTVVAGAGIVLSVGGNLTQTGGRADLVISTLSLAAAGGGVSASFHDAGVSRLVVGGGAASTATVTGALRVISQVFLSPGAHLILSTGVVRFDGNGPFAGAGSVEGTPASVAMAGGASAQTWTSWPGSIGRLRVSNASAGGLFLSTASGASFSLTGGVLVDTGTILRAATTFLHIGGDWEVYGSALVDHSSAAFNARSGTSTIFAGASFDHLVVDAGNGTVLLSTTVLVAGGVAVLTGVFDLASSTIDVRGSWMEQAGSSVRGAASVTLFDGSLPQRITQLGSGSFGTLVLAGAGGVTISSTVSTLSALIWQNGNLFYPGALLRINGDMLKSSYGTLNVDGSTVVLSGSEPQLVQFTTFGDLVIFNQSSLGARLGVNVWCSSFRIMPGAVFNGGSSILTVSGPVWETALSTYIANNPIHVVNWSPASSILVSHGSVVNAKLILAANTTAFLQGDLLLEGWGNTFDPRPGSRLVNALGGSTMTFQDSADLAPSFGAQWFYSGDVANSWMVFEGSGVSRGASISTNTFGGLRVSLAGSGEVFQAPTLNLAGSLIIEGGTFRPSASRIVSVGGDLIQTGGVVDFSAAANSAVILTGASSQTLSLLPGSTLWHLISVGTGTVRAASGLFMRGDLTISTGVFGAGSGNLALAGHFLVSTGAYFDGQTGSVTLAGASVGRSYESVSVYGGASFNTIVISVSSAAFLTSTTVTLLSDAVAGSTLAFAPGVLLTVADLRLRAGVGGPMRVRSRAAGSAWLLRVTAVSSVTAAVVSDCDASWGLPVAADDSHSFDAGGNVHWNFVPSLMIVLPGETFTPSTAPGKIGVPSISTAGVVVSVSVLTVSSRFDLASAATGFVYLLSDDPQAAPISSQAFAAGRATFQFDPRAAEPAPRVTTLTAAAAFASTSTAVSVIPAGLARLQLILPGQAPVPGSITGKVGAPYARVKGVAWSATVRAVDPYSNLVSTVADTVALGASTSSVTLPAAAALVSGQRVFSGLIFLATGNFTIAATDWTQPAVVSDTSSVVNVSPPSLSSPTAGFLIPTGAAVSTLGGALSGTAVDGASVERVRVDVHEVETGLHYDWSGSFSSASPIYSTTALSSPFAPSTSWDNPIADSVLTDGRHYAATVMVDNPSGLTGAASSTFTVDRSALRYGSREGQGSAVVETNPRAGCETVVASVTLTVGSSGLAPGGAVAVRVPDGWSAPLGISTQSLPPGGYWSVTSTSTASIQGSTSILVNPTIYGGQTLGPGWIVLAVNPGAVVSFLPGDRITFTYAGLPPLTSAGLGSQTFAVWTRADASGSLAPIAGQPSLLLTAGTTSLLSFTKDAPLALGPLQMSPLLRLRLGDLCGNETPGVSSGTAALSLLVPGGSGYVVDPTAGFYAASGGAISSVFLSTGFATSPGFFLRVSTAGPSLAYIRAAASFRNAASTITVEAMRPVRLVSSTVAFSAVSVDTGSLSAGTTSVSLSSANPSAYGVRLVFSLPDPELTWEAVLSTDGVNFASPVLRASGVGDAARRIVVSWDGVDRTRQPPRYAAAGRYKVRLRAGGGAAEDRSLEVIVPGGASYLGRLGARGSGAFVRAWGPGAGEGSFAMSSSTGYFQLFGLRSGQSYRLSVSTSVLASGRSVLLSTEIAAPPANSPSVDLGTIPLPSTVSFRVAVVLPAAAPRDVLGGFVGRSPDGAAAFSGPLRFSSGAATSDDAGVLFGRAASTWSSVAAVAGLYDLDIEVPDMRLSTRVASVSLGAAGLDLRVSLEKRANLFGSVILASTVPFGTRVSVQARRPSEASPAAFGGVFISSQPPSVGPSSGAYALYGLDPGSWTILARAPGFVSASTTIVVEASDIVDLDLALGLGGVVVGTVAVSGESRGISQCFAGLSGAPGSCPAGTFELEVEALAVGRLERSAARLRLAASASLSTAAFQLSGLEPGVWTLRSSLPGFSLQPVGGLSVEVAGAGASTAALALVPHDSRLRVDVRVPPLPDGACRAPAAFGGVGLSLSDSDGLERVFGDATTMISSGAFVTLYCSSAAFFSPPLPPGPLRAEALFATTGNWAVGRTVLVDGSTAVLTLDLSGSTLPVSGLLSVAGTLSLTTQTAPGVSFGVAASSPAGILSAAARVSFCLLGSGDPRSLAALRAELVPYDSRDGEPPLRRAVGGAGSCADIAPSTSVATSLGFAASVRGDGFFSFPSGVAPGLYLLRVPGDLDDDPANGNEAVEYRAFVAVGTSAVVLAPRLFRGARVSGLLSASGGLPPGRRARILLRDAGGRTVGSQDVSLGAGGVATFSFDGTADGRYTLAVEDLGTPRVLAAQPQSIVVAGADLAGVVVSLTASGLIRARLSLARLLADGSEEHELIGPDNAALLPRGFSVRATAVPAAVGGFHILRRSQDGSSLDAQGRVVLEGLPSGVYDVEFDVPSDTAALLAGGLSLSAARLSGVSVGPGQAVDLGVVPLWKAAGVSGRVTDSSTGEPVAGLLVAARPSRGSGARPAAGAQAWARTDASGRYLLRGLDPSLRWYDLTAAPRGAAAVGDSMPPYESRRALSVDVSSGAVQDFALAPAVSKIIGRVVAADGSLLRSALGEGATLSLQKAGLVPVEDPLADLSMRTDSDGSFVIPALATGAYRLTASALGLAGAARAVIVSSALSDLGAIELQVGGILSGELRLPDGSSPSSEEVRALAAVAPDSSEFFYAELLQDAGVGAVTGYRLGGLTPGRTYRLVVSGPGASSWSPPEGTSVVLASTSDVRVVDMVLRPEAGPVSFRARRDGERWRLEALFSRPLRARLASDGDPTLSLSAVGGLGRMTEGSLSLDRRLVSAVYDPAAGEESLVLRARAALAAVDWSSTDPSARELTADATATIALAADGLHRAVISNAVGGVLGLEGDPARVVLPRGALSVDASTAVIVDFVRSDVPLMAGGTTSGISPAGKFYDISLPAGTPTRLARPAELSLSYSSSVVDPSRLSVYWYNPASRSYVLQPDVTGASASVDQAARTVTIRVDHFSTYVLLDASAGSIGGSAFSGGDLEAYNFPNPFDLSVKTVTTVHGGGALPVRGTLLRISAPPGVSGSAVFRVFDVTGRLVRTMDCGPMSESRTYYQAWDGRGDDGADVASGLYLGQVELGGRRKTFKMAVLK